MDRVNHVTYRVFDALAELRPIEPAGPSDPAAAHGETAAAHEPETVHRRMKELIEHAMRRGQELGFSRPDTDDIAYALCALVDEAVMAMDAAFRTWWVSRSLQLQFFHTNVAGEGFFERLEAVRADRNRLDVLRVFYLCLLFGFQGRYGVRGGELELAALTEDLAGTFEDAGFSFDGPLSPEATHPVEARQRTTRRVPLLAISASTLVLAALLYVSFRFSLSSQSATLVDELHALRASVTSAAEKE